MAQSREGIAATLEYATTEGSERRFTVMLATELTAEQLRAVKVFALAQWQAGVFSAITARPKRIMIDGREQSIGLVAASRDCHAWRA